jgi:D-alanyl-D-alanine carboxypeptidase (penicillin-binding protein 5/6)
MSQSARLLAAAVIAVVALCSGTPATAAGPDISAPAAIVMDADSGEVLYGRAVTQERPIASTTKLMTALLVLERAKLSDVAPAAPYRALAVESKLGLRTGEKMTVADLMRGLLIYSANDAAVTLAEHVSGSREAFVRDMNERAAELGLRQTRYTNPVGLDAPGNHSSAADLVKLTIKLREFPFFRRVVDTERTTLKSGARPRTIENRNKLVLRVKTVDGVKTGHTQGAGWVLIGSATRRSVSLITVVLGAAGEGARQADTLKLLDYGFRKYQRVTAVKRGQVFEDARVPIRFRAGAKLDLMASRTVRRTIRRGSPRFTYKLLGVPEEVEGPIREGQRFGTIEIFLAGERISRVPLVAQSDVAEAGAARRAKDYFTRPATMGLLALALLASVLVTGLRRRSGARGKARAESQGMLTS